MNLAAEDVSKCCLGKVEGKASGTGDQNNQSKSWTQPQGPGMNFSFRIWASSLTFLGFTQNQFQEGKDIFGFAANACPVRTPGNTCWNAWNVIIRVVSYAASHLRKHEL